MKPSLARSLIVLFSILVIIESVFLGVFCLDIQNADNTAKKESGQVSVAIELGALFAQFDRLGEAFKLASSQPGREDLRREADFIEAELVANVNKAVKRCIEEIGGNRQDLERLEKFGVDFVDAIHAHKLAKGEEEDIRTFKRVALAGKKCVQQFYIELKHLRNIAATKPLHHPLGIQPTDLLNLAAVINVAFLVFSLLFLKKSIIDPLGRLSAACDKIRSRLPLDPFPVMRTEIGALQSSFQQMSAQIIENEKRRNSYVALLQTVQISALNRVKELLQGISGNSQVPAKVSQRLERASKNLDSVLDLLRSMTAQLSQSEPSQVIAEPVECEAAVIFQNAASSVDSLLQERAIKLEMSQCDFRLRVDPLLLGRVVLNLLSNAIKYSPNESTVQLSATLKDGVFQCFIKDNGPGISAEGKAKLFKRFSQLDALDGVKRSGTGLGLVICKEIIEAHGGEIGCESEPGKGSSFWFKIPQPGDSNTAVVPTKAKSDVVAIRAKHDGKKQSIIFAFLAVLALFFAAQAYQFVELHKSFSESAQRTQIYGKMKDQLLLTEELYAAYLTFAKRIQVGYLNHDLAGLKKSLPFFKEQRNQLNDFISAVGKDNVAYPALLKVRSQETKLYKTLSYYGVHVDEILSNTEVVKGFIEAQAHDVEREFVKALQLASEAFRISFDGSQDLRNKIIVVLSCAGAADLILIAAAAYIGLGLAGKILILKSKAESFAAGQHISPSLKGSDELSFLDQRLCQVAGEIEQAESEKKEILAIINHDLRTPLASLYSTTQVISQGVIGALPEKELASVKSADKELQQLLLQINDLLLLEKIEAASYEMARQDCELNDLLQSAIESFKEMSTEKNLNLVTEWKGAGHALALNVDRTLFQRLIEVVLKNAIAVSPSSSRIKLTVTRDEDLALLAVEDSGSGVNPELLPSIFDRFRFVDGKPLAGFGLPLAERICRLHDARIEVKSGSPCVVEIYFKC